MTIQMLAKQAALLTKQANPLARRLASAAGVGAGISARRLGQGGLGAGAGYLGHVIAEGFSPAATAEERRLKRNARMALGAGAGLVAGVGQDAYRRQQPIEIEISEIK